MTAALWSRPRSSLLAMCMRWYLLGEIKEQRAFIRALQGGGVVTEGSPAMRRQQRRLQALECRLAIWQR